MDKARLFQDGKVGKVGKRVFAHEIDDEPWWRRQKVSLVCPFCVTAVVSQRTSVGRHPRGALFRLAADQSHEQECPLNPTEVLQKIAHGSQGVAVIDGDELHLVLPDDLGQVGATIPTADPDATSVGDTFGVNISTVRPLLPPLINSAVVIARFLQKHGYDPDVVAQFKVRRPGEKSAVSWDKFCHGPAAADHARLHARLTSGVKPAHPVAVYGRITAVEKDRQERPVLRLSDGPGYTVRIRSDHPSLLEPLTAGAFVLAVGTWKPWTPSTGRTEVQMFAEEHWQLAHWTYDATTGHSSPPHCPAPLSLAQRTLRQARQTSSAAAAERPSAPPHPVRPSPRPRPTRPSGPAAPPASLPTPPPEPAQTPPPGPAVPQPTPAEPAPPAHPPLPSRPPAPPRPTAPPLGRTRRGWWPFGRR
ncbi:hypothetical protein ACI2L1_24600 [Streptomyces sp. NPDC019531]|uniref:hypothetical protein n=1 Tax=Streptomyces sp. NPDC019531 TaxID=3365062 RepID=UPI00385063C9